MPLTDTAIRKAKPADKAQRLRDGGGPYVELSLAGSKWWSLKYRFDGKESKANIFSQASCMFGGSELDPDIAPESS